MFHFFKFLFHIAPFLILAYLWIQFDLGHVIGSFISSASDKISSFSYAHQISPFNAPIFHR
jgi:hypothetical protein